MTSAYPDSVTSYAPLRTVRDLLLRVRGYLAQTPADETPMEAADRRDTLRRAAGIELSRLTAERDATLPALAAAEEKARKHLEKITPGYRQAVADFDRAQAAHGCRAHDFAYAAGLQVRRIEAAAEPIIEETARGLLDLLEGNRKTPIEEDERNKVWDSRGNRYVGEIWTNVPSIEARRVAIMEARRVAEDMKSDPDQSNIRERLAALIEGLPDPTVLIKVADPQFYTPITATTKALYS